MDLGQMGCAGMCVGHPSSPAASKTYMGSCAKRINGNTWPPSLPARFIWSGPVEKNISTFVRSGGWNSLVVKWLNG